MVDQLFTSLSRMTEQGSAWALAAALGWGMLSIILSPCHLASIPLVVAYLNHGQITQTRRAFLLTGLFSLGIFLSTIAIGFITALCGSMLGDIGPWGKYLVAVVFLVFGLVLLEVIRLPWSSPNMSQNTKTGLWGAFLLGLAFGTAVGPCTFAYMAPLLAIIFDNARTNFAYSSALILLYSIGHCGLIILAGTLGVRIQFFLNWNEKTKIISRIRQGCGVLLLSVGLYLIWTA